MTGAVTTGYLDSPYCFFISGSPEASLAIKPPITDKQGKSGLGLEAQREAIARFAAAESLEVVGEFIEVETGKGADALDKRPQLAAALRRAKQLGAHIAVSKARMREAAVLMGCATLH